MAQNTSLSVTINTSSALINQFLASLNALDSQQQRPGQSTDHPSPLLLLSASATSLKSTVTKLSLLTITAPFTQSVVASTLQTLNTSILPSLVTAALLISPSLYPKPFADESTILCRALLRDLTALLSLTKKRAEDGQPTKDMIESDKKIVTGATGKVWEDCDLLMAFANDGLPAFVCKKARQWLDLMKDAVRELEEWDPEEEIGTDPFGLDDTQSDDAIAVGSGSENHVDRVTMSVGVKNQAIKVLNRIPQSIHVVVNQRLAKMPEEITVSAPATHSTVSTERNRLLEKILKKAREISGCIDESAEAMYMGDLEMCLKKAGEARALTIEVIEAVSQPWKQSDTDTKEDLYIRRALAWIQQVDSGAQVTSVRVDGGRKSPT